MNKTFESNCFRIFHLFYKPIKASWMNHENILTCHCGQIIVTNDKNAQHKCSAVDRGGAAPPNNYGEKNVFTDEIPTYMN